MPLIYSQVKAERESIMKTSDFMETPLSGEIQWSVTTAVTTGQFSKRSTQKRNLSLMLI